MNTRHFKQVPKAYKAMPKLFKDIVLKAHPKEKVLKPAEYIVDQFKVDTQHLAQYKSLTDFQTTGTIPAIYLGVLSQSVQMHMMAYESFPFPVLGLVHIRNQLTQYRPIREDEVLTLSCKFGELELHDKGMQFDFITEVRVGNEKVMSSLTTYLARQKVQHQAAKTKVTPKTWDYQPAQTWDIPENIGRRYAANSNDYNFIHLHKLTAKAFGFKQAIAHGMWTKAKAMAHMDLPDAYSIDVDFKLPMYLPSKVDFLKAEDSNEKAFLIRNQKSQKPHVAGRVKSL